MSHANRPETRGRATSNMIRTARHITCAHQRRSGTQLVRKAKPLGTGPVNRSESPSPWLLILGAALLAVALLLLQPSGVAVQGILASLPHAEQSASLPYDANEESWSLVLVNATHPLPDDFKIETTVVEDGHKVDARIATQLEAMLSDCRAVGLHPFIRSSFRTHEEQEQILDDRIAEYEQEGYSHDGATAEALRWVAQPGTSEHELGLAVDINDRDDDGGVYAWLAEHAHEYGFILRYPADKIDVTCISNEPWHYRYVGTRAAANMHDSGEALEEYLGDTKD